MKIMVAVDGSRNALRALRFAIRLLRRMEGRGRSLTLISVHDDAALRSASHFVGRQVVDDYLADMSRKDLAEAVAAATRSGLKFSVLTRTGPIAATITDAAQDGKFDLLVLGSKGRSSIKNLLVGSVAQRVASLCKVPVTLVK